jgi:signal transduction histidine kinase/CheY-like chemotaxis protein
VRAIVTTWPNDPDVVTSCLASCLATSDSHGRGVASLRPDYRTMRLARMSDDDRHLEATMTLGLVGHESTEHGGDPAAQLVILVGPDAGRRVPVHDDIVIGRDADVGVAVQDDGVSRRHSAIRRNAGGEFIIEDLGSRNGTFVNGLRIGTAQLHSGDKVAIGSTTILLFTRHDRYEEQVLQAQKLHLLGQLAGGIAHDFNNLIVTVLGNVTYLKDKPTSASETADCLDEIESAARRAAELTSQLMSFARPQRRAREVVVLEQLVAEVVGLLRRTVPRSLEILTDVPPNLGVIGDPTQLLQVLMNGCVNAKQAMPSGGVLRIEATIVPGPAGHGPFARVVISDTGVGMDATTLAAAFQPFFTTKAKGEGTGLGLATAYRIIRAHGGDVALTSEPGIGTRFIVTLPAINSSDTVPIDLAPQQRARLEGRALVVDDEQLVRNTTRRILERFGMEVVIAVDGLAAVEAHASATVPFDVAIVDLDMPNLDGEQAIAHMRARDPSLRVIVASGHSDATRESRLIAAGNTTMLNKPFDADGLWQHVAAALGMPRGSSRT